jgi:hypothetical protein
MSQQLDELYLVWLYGQISDIRATRPSRSFWNLARELYTTPFEWFVPHDDARVDDGLDLRHDFIAEAMIPEVDPDWMDLECSYLELLVALSRRLGFQTDEPPADWFWVLIQNMGLIGCNDTYRGDLKRLVKEVTDQITNRTYDTDGRGGLFPLRNAKKDQTKIDIWYQLCAYIIENE